VLEFDDSLLDPFAADGLTVPLLRLNEIHLPQTEIMVGNQEYEYSRSYPVKGYGAVMPKFLLEQVAAGKKPLIVERMDRYYVYLSKEPAAAAAS
jgi:hypothetical protein